MASMSRFHLRRGAPLLCALVVFLWLVGVGSAQTETPTPTATDLPPTATVVPSSTWTPYQMGSSVGTIAAGRWPLGAMYAVQTAVSMMFPVQSVVPGVITIPISILFETATSAVYTPVPGPTEVSLNPFWGMFPCPGEDCFRWMGTPPPEEYAVPGGSWLIGAFVTPVPGTGSVMVKARVILPPYAEAGAFRLMVATLKGTAWGKFFPNVGWGSTGLSLANNSGFFVTAEPCLSGSGGTGTVSKIAVLLYPDVSPDGETVFIGVEEFGYFPTSVPGGYSVSLTPYVDPAVPTYTPAPTYTLTVPTPGPTAYNPWPDIVIPIEIPPDAQDLFHLLSRLVIMGALIAYLIDRIRFISGGGAS